MGKTTLKVELIRCTPDAEALIAMAGRLCYSPADLETLKDGAEKKDPHRYLGMLMDMGHLSPVEHASFTFLVEGVSRALLAQLTRHRLASFSVQSQRYVSQRREQGCFDYVLPPAIEALGEAAVQEFERQMMTMQQWYNGWQDKLGRAGESSNEDARFVLPNASATRLMMTMNARELIHFFKMRCCNRAQWEIRDMAWQMLILAHQAAPALFQNAGPGCITGKCPEGKKTCGKMAQVRQQHRARLGLNTPANTLKEE